MENRDAVQRRVPRPIPPAVAWFLGALLYFLLWAWIIPPWQAPDEPLHYEYALAMSELHRLPTAADISPERQQRILSLLAESDFWRYLGEPTPHPMPEAFAQSPDPFLSRSGTQIGDEPALYYIIPAVAFQGISDPVHRLRFMRLYSALLSAVVVALAYATARELWPDRRMIAHVAAGWVALLPMAGFIGSSANNDALVNLWGGLLAWWMVRGSRCGWTPARLGALALILCALPLSKKLGLALMPLGGVVLVWSLLRGMSPRRRRWFGLGLGLLCVLTLAVFLRPVPDQPAAWGRRGPVRYGARTPLVAHSGRYAFLLPDLGVEKPSWIVQALPEAIARRMRGHVVTLRAWVRSDVPSRIRLTVDDGVASKEKVFGTTERWQEVALSGQIAPEATRLRIIFSREEGAYAGAVYLDDVSLIALGHEWIANGSAESPKRYVEGFAAAYLRLPPWFLRGLLEPSSYDLAALRRYGLYIALLFPNFWANFGWLTLPLPIWAYGVIALVCAFVAWGWRYGRRLWAARWQRRALILLTLQMAFMVVGILLPMIGRDWQPQGRYLFPALVPVAIGWAGGWAGWGDRLLLRRWWIAPMAFMAGVAIGSLWGIVIPHYYLGPR